MVACPTGPKLLGSYTMANLAGPTRQTRDCRAEGGTTERGQGQGQAESAFQETGSLPSLALLALAGEPRSPGN